MSQDKEVANEIRIGITSKPKDIISKCEKLLKEDKVKDLHLSAVGNSIGELVIYVEILKSIFPKLSQKSVFSTITPAPSKKEKKTDDKTQKLLPKLEVIVSTEKEKESGISCLEDELVFDYYMWANRRERRHANWFPMSNNPQNGPTILRWYGAKIPKNEYCTICSENIKLLVD